MNVLVFAASSNSQSINKKLASYASRLLNNANIDLLDLNDYSLPLFSEDVEKDIGQPQAAHDFLAKIKNSDAIIVSFAEHNGSYSAVYKNLFDWCSRINPKVYADKKMILLATSPGASGASSVLASASASMPFFGANVLGSLSVPNFFDVFDLGDNCLKDETLKQKLSALVSKLQT